VLQSRLLSEIAARYRTSGVVILGVVIDRTRGVVEDYLRKNSLNYDVVWADPKGNISKAYEVTRVPTTVIIGRDGRVCRTFDQVVDTLTLGEVIDALLGKGAKR
jgi:peroxiredoxin